MQPSPVPSLLHEEGGGRSSRLEQEMEAVFDTETIERLAETYGLSAFLGSLQSALRNAGLLYTQYGPKNTNLVHDLAPKFRTVARAAEVARTLDAELSNLEFWDRWKIYKRLEETGHPITDNLDNHSKTNPLVAGNIIVEEIRLILNAITRYETEFFDAVTGTSENEMNIGLYFFVEVMGAFWETATGERVLRPTRDSKITETAIDFLRDCLALIDPVDSATIEKTIRDTRR